MGSGVTKVGVTRCRIWWVSPFLPQKLITFLVIVTTLSAFPGNRLSSVLIIQPQKYFDFYYNVTPGCCHPGRSSHPPPSGATDHGCIHVLKCENPPIGRTQSGLEMKGIMPLSRIFLIFVDRRNDTFGSAFLVYASFWSSKDLIVTQLEPQKNNRKHT